MQCTNRDTEESLWLFSCLILLMLLPVFSTSPALNFPGLFTASVPHRGISSLCQNMKAELPGIVVQEALCVVLILPVCRF